MGVASGSQNLDNAVADVQDGHIEGAAAQVIDHDLLLGFLVQAVGQSRSGGLVDDPLHIQTGDLTGVLGGLTLGVREVGGNGDDGFGDALSQISLGICLQLREDHSADFLGGVALAVNGDVVIFTHVTLDGRDGAVRVGNSLTLCHLANHPLAGLGEGHHGRSGAVAFGVGNDSRLTAFQHGYAGIGSTKVNTDNFTHNLYPPKIL